MSRIIKPLSSQVALSGTGSDISSARLVRLFSSEAVATDRVVTLDNVADPVVTLGTITIPGQGTVYIAKEATDTLLVDSGSTVMATKIAFA